MWVLPDGRMLRIARQRHPSGGLLLIFSDITNEVSLKSSYDALLQTQKAALDKLHEAIVVFGLDGRLKLSNAAFSKMWTLEPTALEDDMPFDKSSPPASTCSTTKPSGPRSAPASPTRRRKPAPNIAAKCAAATRVC